MGKRCGRVAAEERGGVRSRGGGIGRSRREEREGDADGIGGKDNMGDLEIKRRNVWDDKR